MAAKGGESDRGVGRGSRGRLAWQHAGQSQQINASIERSRRHCAHVLHLHLPHHLHLPLLPKALLHTANGAGLLPEPRNAAWGGPESRLPKR